MEGQKWCKHFKYGLQITKVQIQPKKYPAISWGIRPGKNAFDMPRFYESSLSGVNPSELLRLCPAAEAEAQQERGSNPETQGNFFRVW